MDFHFVKLNPIGIALQWRQEAKYYKTLYLKSLFLFEHRDSLRPMPTHREQISGVKFLLCHPYSLYEYLDSCPPEHAFDLVRRPWRDTEIFYHLTAGSAICIEDTLLPVGKALLVDDVGSFVSVEVYEEQLKERYKKEAEDIAKQMVDKSSVVSEAGGASIA